MLYRINLSWAGFELTTLVVPEILVNWYILKTGLNFTISTNIWLNPKMIDLIWFLVFNANFSYIMATSFSGGSSRSTWREPPTMGKQLVSFITCDCESSAPFFVNPRKTEKTWINVKLALSRFGYSLRQFVSFLLFHFQVWYLSLPFKLLRVKHHWNIQRFPNTYQ